MSKADSRNQFVDIMRGIATLLVVLEHTMTGCTADSQKSFLFNIIWSLQIPLFILISGYVTKYSRAIRNANDLWQYVKRRTIAYMLPWAVWSFLVRGVIFGQENFLNIKSLLWNMDSGYWFLATIWTISMIFGVSSFSAGRIGKENRLKKEIILLAFYLFGMVLLIGGGILLGFSFFAIKLTLYYMPFFFAGYLYGQIDDTLFCSEKGKKIVDYVVAICFVMWLFVILRYSLYEMPDGGLAIILRAATSLAGCIAVCGLCKGIFSEKIGGGLGEGCRTFAGNLPHALSAAQLNQSGQHSAALQSDLDEFGANELHNHSDSHDKDHNSDEQKRDIEVFADMKEKLRELFLWAGKRSLEVYMVHGLLLNIFKSNVTIQFSSIEGYLLTAGNFALTVGLCAIVINLLNQNTILKKVLMGR